MHERVSMGLHCHAKVSRLLEAIALLIPTPGADLPQGRSGTVPFLVTLLNLQSPLPPLDNLLCSSCPLGIKLPFLSNQNKNCLCLRVFINIYHLDADSVHSSFVVLEQNWNPSCLFSVSVPPSLDTIFLLHCTLSIQFLGYRCAALPPSCMNIAGSSPESSLP